MSNRMKRNQNPDLPATDLGPKPGDFPLGSAQSRAAARSIIESHAAEQRKIEAAEFGNLTPFEAAMSEGCTGYKKRLAVGVAQMMEERARVFQFSWPAPEEIRHKFAVAKEIDRLADGHGRFLKNNDRVEWDRLKAIAEESVKAMGH